MPDIYEFTDQKRAAEKIRREVDFAARMEAGDTVQSVQVTATDHLGTVVTTDLIDSPTVSGTKGRWTNKAWGAVGGEYYVRVVVTTVGTDTLVAVVKLEIKGL